MIQLAIEKGTEQAQKCLDALFSIGRTHQLLLRHYADRTMIDTAWVGQLVYEMIISLESVAHFDEEHIIGNYAKSLKEDVEKVSDEMWQEALISRLKGINRIKSRLMWLSRMLNPLEPE